MDIAILLEAGFRHVIANTTQLHKVSGRIGSKRWAFLDRSHALSKGINVSRAVALSLGTALACAFVTSPRAADLIGQVPLRAPPSVAVPYDWTGAYVGGHVGYAAGSSDWSAGQAGGVGSVGRIDLTKGFDAFKGSGGFLGGLQGGYNVVLPSRLLIGVEADASFPNAIAGTVNGAAGNGIASYGDTVLHYGTARGRIGYVFDNNWVFFGTGGFAWSHDQIARTQLADGSLPSG